MINESNETLITNDIIMIEYDNGNIFRIKVSFWDIFLLVKRGTSPTYGDFELGKSSLHVFFCQQAMFDFRRVFSGGFRRILQEFGEKFGLKRTVPSTARIFAPPNYMCNPPLIIPYKPPEPGYSFFGCFYEVPTFLGGSKFFICGGLIIRGIIWYYLYICVTCNHSYIA